MTGPSRGTVLWVARQVIRQHTEPADESRATGRCGQCRDDGCPLLVWAYHLLARIAHLAGQT